jgi:hypothetical protein
LGGWDSEGPTELRLRVVDPSDPRPPRLSEEDYWDFWQRRQEEEGAAKALRVKAALMAGAFARSEALRTRPEAWFSSRELAEDVPLALELTKFHALDQVEQELKVCREAREIRLQVWFNGQRQDLDLDLNQRGTLYLRPQAGENRLEIHEPRSGLVEVRTWWFEGKSSRLSIQATDEGHAWSDPGLTVMEPGGKLNHAYSHFSSDHPKPGTYTLRWAQGLSRWDEHGDAPRKVRVEVLLDGGTDRERRWHFEGLVLPGAGPLILGSFDVES